MKNLLIGMMLLFSISAYSQISHEPKLKERYFLITIKSKGTNMTYWTESNYHFPSKENIEKYALDNKLTSEEETTVILNIMEFKSKQDWKDFNYATWKNK